MNSEIKDLKRVMAYNPKLKAEKANELAILEFERNKNLAEKKRTEQ